MSSCNTTVLYLLYVLFLTNASFSIVAPILPPVLEEKGIDERWIGLIFAAFPIAKIPTALVVGKVVDSCGHTKMIAISCAL